MSGRNNISFLALIHLGILAGCLSPSVSDAQEIARVDFIADSSKVEITYEITACSGNEDYDVRLFLGHDGELSEIKQGLSGDLEHVACGSSNVIVWHVLNDREELKGPIFFVVEIMRAHNVITEDYAITDEGDDGRPAGAVPWGDPVSGTLATGRVRQNGYPAPLAILQLGAWIAFEQARAAILAHGRPTVIFQNNAVRAFPQRKRHR